MDAVVYDVPSQALLFRAAGESAAVKGRSSPLNVDPEAPDVRVQGFEKATGSLIASLNTALARSRSRPGTARSRGRARRRSPCTTPRGSASPPQSGGGGALGIPELILAALLGVSLLARRRRPELMKRFPWIILALVALCAAAALVPGRLGVRPGPGSGGRDLAAADRTDGSLDGADGDLRPRHAARARDLAGGPGGPAARGRDPGAGRRCSPPLAVHGLSPGSPGIPGQLRGGLGALRPGRGSRRGFARSVDARPGGDGGRALSRQGGLRVPRRADALRGSIAAGVRVVPLVHLLGGLGGIYGGNC